jgi:uncharacterized protein (DUF302 family)
MNSEQAVIAYSVSEPFDRALRTIRQALAGGGLSITGELDVSNRIRREFNIGFERCVILLVDSPALLLEAVALDRAAAALLPLHVVVSSRDSQTMIHWSNPTAVEGIRLPAGAAAPIAKLLSLLSHTLEQIAMRCELYPAISHGKQ